MAKIKTRQPIDQQAREKQGAAAKGGIKGKKEMKILRFAVLLAALAGFSFAASAQDTIKSITIATEGAYEPWNFTTSDGKLDGLEVDLANDLCARMKVKCTIVAQDWDGLIPSLIAGKFDVIMASMFITDKRLEVMDFTQPYAVDPASFAVAKDSELGKMGMTQEKVSLNDKTSAKAAIDKLKPLLKGKTIGVQAATLIQKFVETYFSDEVEIRSYKTTEQHDLDLLAGRVDGLFAQQTALAATLAKPEYANYTIAGPGFAGGLFGLGTGAGLRKEDTQLKDMLNKAIDEAIADGTIKRLSLKWVNADVTPVK